MAKTETRKSNRLINEKSPYLLQHAYNPVDWYPWGEEAFDRARAENKPVFLSIGYSTCHWCHVMERESFEDPKVAALLNEHFVAVKVDREERPDLDHIYMTACQALTGHGGWPLTVFLTPDRKPFFAGTYFPRESRYGLSGMVELVPKLASLWERERTKVSEAGEELLQAVRRQSRAGNGGEMPGKEVLDQAYRRLHDSFDERYGGFGGVPKFPAPHQLMFLLRYWKRSGETGALEMVSATLQAMARGGIFDQLGYGFHRYSTDSAWLVPHFEKMLYDQALLAMACLEAYQATGIHEFAATARHTFEYVLRDMLSPDEAFCAAEDADSEGEEGVFYVWTPGDIKEILGEKRGRIVAGFYGVTDSGNFDRGRSILHRPRKKEQFAREKGIDIDGLNEILEESREALLEVRSRRERPFKDDKVLTGWNGLMIAALARGAAVMEAPLYAQVAASAVAMIKNRLTDGDRLLRRYRDGEAAGPAFLDDYAFMVWGLIELYEATFNTAYLRWAVSLNDTMLELFENVTGGALNYRAGDSDEALPDFQDAYDGAAPSGNSVAALNLLRLGRMTGRSELEQRGEEIIRSFSHDLQASPTSFTFMLAALDFALGPAAELVIAGETGSEPAHRLAAAARKLFSPGLTVLFHPVGVERKEIEALAPFIEPMAARNGQAAAYLCRNQSCLPPISDAGQLTALINETAPGAAD